MKELAAADAISSNDLGHDEVPPIDLQSLVDGIAALDRFDSVLAEFERSLEPVRAPETDR